MAWTLITAAEFEERFDIEDASTIDEKRFMPHVGSARTRLRRWVGEERYAQAIALNEAADPDVFSPYEWQLLNDLKNVEAHLAFHYAILGMNSPIGPKGILKIARAEGNATHQYLSPTETAQISTQFLELAREICEPYMANDGTPSTPFEVTEDAC